MPIYENLTVAEAIQEGLQVLGITKDQAVIEVLDEGKKGFLGLGKKQARVSIEKRIVEEPAPVEEVPAK
ncbi:RNA-binding protein, partial [Listeria monocytogenes]|nr:RNA-binding protein [Listeria monocytogenes]